MPYAKFTVNPNENKDSMKIRSKGHPKKVALNLIGVCFTYGWIKKAELKRIAETGLIDLPKKRKHKKKKEVFGFGRKKNLF